MTTLAIVGQLILVSLAFLAGTTYTDSTREQANRRQANEWRRINAARSSLRSCQHQRSVTTRATVLFTDPDLYEEDEE